MTYGKISKKQQEILEYIKSEILKICSFFDMQAVHSFQLCSHTFRFLFLVFTGKKWYNCLV